MISMKFSLLKAVGGPATQYIPGMGHGPIPGGTYACQWYIPK